MRRRPARMLRAPSPGRFLLVALLVPALLAALTGWLRFEYGRSEGLAKITGQVLGGNRAMLAMCRDLGFRVRINPEKRNVYETTLTLTGSPTA